MNPKVLVAILFLITFTVSFAIYFLVVSFITPHIDLSSTAKKEIEIAPELNESNFTKGKVDNRISEIQEKATQDEETYQSDISTLLNEGVKAPDANNNDQQKEEATTGKLDEHDPLKPEKKETENTKNPNNQHEVQQQKPKNNDIQAVSANQTGNQTKPVLDTNKNPFDTGLTSKKSENTTQSTTNDASVNRVMVGSYSSMDEAKQAYNSMVSSNSNLAPIIKENNGKYSLQVGAFSDKQKAESLVKTLNNQNYSATVKSE